MTLRSPVPWLVAVLIVLLAGTTVTGIAAATAREAAQARLSAQTEWGVLESMMYAQMTRATHGSAPFEAHDMAAEEARMRDRQEALTEVAPHAEDAIDLFIDYILATSTPEDAARENSISLLIMQTRQAVLSPLRERAEAWDRVATWSSWTTGALGVAGTVVALWRSRVQQDQLGRR